MKFTRYIIQVMVPEWIKLYLNFGLLKTYLAISTKLKTLLVLAKKTKSLQEYKTIKTYIGSQITLLDKMNFDNSEFVLSFKEEIDKIEAFITWKSNDLQIKMSKLKNQVKSMKANKESLDDSFEEYLAHNTQRRKQNVSGFDQQIPNLIFDKKNDIVFEEFEKNKIKLLETFYTFYNECVHFQSYVDVNCEGIRKILKKYKKCTIKGIRKTSDEKLTYKQILQRMDITGTPDQIKGLLFDTEQIMIRNFYLKDSKVCRDNLRKYSQDGIIDVNTYFKFGLFAGLALILIIIIIFMRYEGYLNPNEDPIFIQVIPCFRGIALFLLYYWVIAINVGAWNYNKINYKIYLGFNHHFSTLTELLKRVTILSSVFLLLFVTYCLQAKQQGNLFNQLTIIDPIYLPLIVWLICIFYVFVPTYTRFNGQGRKWMFQMIAGSVYGHFRKHESRYTFFTEQLVSLIIPLSDFDYTACFYYKLLRDGDTSKVGTCETQYRYVVMVISILPFVMICMQQITRVRDKYKFWDITETLIFLKNLLVMQLGIVAYFARTHYMMQYLWIFFAVLCAPLTFWWDVRQDWLIFDPNCKYKFIRDDFGYHNPQYLLVINFILRCMWTFSISPGIIILFFEDHVYIQWVIFFIGAMELMRRLIYNFLKIEKEHIINQNLFKTVIDYKFPFDQKQIYKSLDGNLSQVNSANSISTIIKIDPNWQREEGDNASDCSITKQFFPMDYILQRQNGTKSKVGSEISKMIPTGLSPIRRARNKDEQSVRDNRLIVLQDQFRLSQYVKKEQEIDKNQEQLDISFQTVNLQVLNKARTLEILQVHKTLELKQNNKQFQELITYIYKKFNIFHPSQLQQKKFNQLNFFNWI